jgi:chromatin-remodeling ATPase INO80
MTDLLTRCPLKQTPSRAAELMSFSNILSSSEPVSKAKPDSPAADNDKPKEAEPDVEAEVEPKLKREPEPEPEIMAASEKHQDDDQATEPMDDDNEVEADDGAEVEADAGLDAEAGHASEKGGRKRTKQDKPSKGAKASKREKPVKQIRKPRKSRTSEIKAEATTPKVSSRRASTNKESSTPRVGGTKRQANGQPKAKGLPVEKEKKVLNAMAKLDAAADDLDMDDLEEEFLAFKQRGPKRQRLMESADAEQNALRRLDFTEMMTKGLAVQADRGKRRYDNLFYDEALTEVRERELFAEKERKKDMQRKRRREKSMAVTMEQKEAALARANAAQDETERQKHLRDAERANKKAQQTKLILQKGIKGPARNLVELNLEGGTMSTFHSSDLEPGKTKKGRGGPRPKKSKEQKQAEKESAEAAQAAIDAGEELPSKEETKIRIKLNKKPKDKDGEKPEKEKTKGKGKKNANATADVDVDIEVDGDAEKEKEPKKPKQSKKEEKAAEEPPSSDAKFQTKGFNQIYDQIWRDLARKDVSKAFKLAVDSYQTKSSNLKKTAILASKEAKRWQLRTNKGTKDQQARAKRVMRDMMSFWKRNEREERDLRKAAEKQEQENARKEEAEREAARQKRKLNFLISQTELYSHFIGKKIKTAEVERSTDNPEITDNKDRITETKLDVEEPTGPVASKVTNFEDLDFDAEDEASLRAAAIANAQNAIQESQAKARAFNDDAGLDEDGEMNFQNPTGLGDVEIEQPQLLNCQLKEYQLKGLNWLVNLYEQGINGILADEMGLGKTVQSISVMAYLAEKHDIWGPFLVVAPASTLHNWQQEIKKFVPTLKVLPYWGTAGDRKVLRKFWDRKHRIYKKETAPFNVCVTSYQVVVSDVAYFSKMRWQYMILDEAQAIKSSSSARWKSLLGFNCRNRLLLTGTPIQNNMQELWALLHFIMPTLFDSHDEFSEWFSKDIESHAQSNTKLNEDQLKRLHMILKPFMLRRVKKHVQKELGDKIELDVFCDLNYRQRRYYTTLRNMINLNDLVQRATSSDDNDSGTLMNLVMQFRKVCNHPDLFERADTTSPFLNGYYAETGSLAREGNNVTVGYSTRSLIEYELPRLVWREDGRLHKPSSDNTTAGWRNKYLNHMMNIWTPENVKNSSQRSGAFSWLRFADLSPGEVYAASHLDVFIRAAELARQRKVALPSLGQGQKENEGYTPNSALFQIHNRRHRQPLADISDDGILNRLMNISRDDWDETGLTRLELAARPAASAPPIEMVCSSSGTSVERESILFNVPMRRILYGPNHIEEKALVTQKVPLDFYPSTRMLPAPDSEKKRFNSIVVPSMRRFVTDSGKLAKLDALLTQLKEEGHRVLLYFQMTKMIDLVEEYLTYRKYKYCRLDGSTKLEDRRDTVHDFQTRPEIFIFLLSTRAGGLGINLTTADTVIFYDSDWNPTIDSQAMDRAHRLGQTRQVTVYRLITRGTIEERIRKRALQKEEVQRVVIQGGGASVDFSGRRMPESKNRDIAMWLADDEQAAEIERKEKEMLESGEFDKIQKKRGGKRKRAVDHASLSLDEMYHEGKFPYVKSYIAIDTKTIG